MVRLKDVTVIRGTKTETLFQFQYGAIKSVANHKKTGKIWDFNSNMVRLKVINLNQLLLVQQYFNSNMVRLKAILPQSLLLQM